MAHATPQLIQFARTLGAPPAHRVTAATVLAYGALLSEGERWFCNAALRVPTLSPRLLESLQRIAAKVERLRP